MPADSNSSVGVIVLGPYRSGTSVTAQVLSALGVDFGPQTELVPPNKMNPGGFYERRDINAANNALIKSAGATLADPGDPRELSKRCDPGTLRIANMSWTKRAGLWGIKDPRMCAALLAWVEAGLLDRQSLRIVNVLRSLDDTVRSAMNFPVIQEYCDGTEQGVRTMLARYVELADWHVQNLGAPALQVEYEFLVSQPAEAVGQMAAFLGVENAGRVRRAVKVIGKGKGQRTLLFRRYFILGLRRLRRILSGGQTSPPQPH